MCGADDVLMIRTGDRPPRLCEQGHVACVQSEARACQSQHTQVLDLRLEARLFVQDAEATGDEPCEAADPEGDCGCGADGDGVCGWATC